MATYKQIQAWVKQQYGFTAETCWIAHVKSQVGLPVRSAWNRISDERQVPCPQDKVASIKEALRHFGMIGK